MRHTGAERVADVVGAIIGVALAWVWVACTSANPDPRPARDAGAETSTAVDAGVHNVSPDKGTPVHDVTPVCADDAAGCSDADTHACPPWCPAGGPVGHHQMR